MKTNCMFLRNMWINLADNENTDLNTIYQEDWSFLDVSNIKRLTTEECLEEYNKLLESEFDIEFFRTAWLASSVRDDNTKDLILNLCRNRMVMGGLRYGKLKDSNYEGYDLLASIYLRESLAWQTETYEPMIDSYNFIYLQYLKTGRDKKYIGVAAKLINKLDFAINVMHWDLGAQDDKIHSIKHSDSSE